MKENRNTYLKYLDGSIAALAALVSILIYQYYTGDLVRQWILIAAFAAVGAYYAGKLIQKRYQSVDFIHDIRAVVLLNEYGNFIHQWNIDGKIALLIGKNTKTKEVDIDLGNSAYDALIHEEHAILNFAAGQWYLEGLHTPSSISIKKSNDKMRYRLTGSRPCRLEQGDVIYIANTRLLMK